MTEDFRKLDSEKKTKGNKTRENILFESRKIFNEEGIFLTLSGLSKMIGITIGGITNHFPTKEHLFVGLAEEYEAEMELVTKNQDYRSELNFEKIYSFFGSIMDIQFKHRSVILFFSAAHQSQKILLSQATKEWGNRQKRLENLVKAFVQSGLVEERIMGPLEFEIFRFQFVNLFTTWLVSFTLYGTGKSYEEMKPIYLVGILRVFDKYLTEKGKAQLEALQLI